MLQRQYMCAEIIFAEHVFADGLINSWLQQLAKVAATELLVSAEAGQRQDVATAAVGVLHRLVAMMPLL